MAAEYDVVIAGAGHNSLISAAYLTRAGLRCLVLEARAVIGGDTATEELTLPGFWHDTCSTAHNLIQSSPMLRNDELHLGDFGLEYLHPDPVIHVPFPDGTALTMWRDIDQSAAEFARFSSADAAAYRRMMEEYDAVKAVFGAARYTPIGFGPSLDERLAEHPDGARWLRRNRESAWNVIEREFEDEHTRTFMLWMAMLTMQPPERPGTGTLAYSLAFGRQMDSWVLPKGGSGQLPDALVRLIESGGGTVLGGRKVSSLILEGGRCVGVETESGERFRADKAVLSTIHVKHLIDMAPADSWHEDFRMGVDTWRAGISMMPTHYATTAPPVYSTAGVDQVAVAAGIPTSVERMLRIGPDFMRRRVDLDEPPLLVLCPTVADPGRAPDGKHTLKVIGVQPYELLEGPEHWDEIKEEVAANDLEHLRKYAPNLTPDTILATTVKSPLDLERTNAHNWHGSCHGGDQDIAQMGPMRPAPGWAQHRMPIDGLYQTGGTTHPGPSVSGGPGRNAAWVLLSDLGYDFEAVATGR